jgi:hypothetical protein
LRVGLFGQQLGGDDAGRIAHELQLDGRVFLFEGSLVGLHLVGFERCVDKQLGAALGRGGESQREQSGRHGGTADATKQHGKSLGER